MRDKIKTIKWSFKLAWEIDKKMLLLWYSISAFISVLPAIMLIFQKDVLARLSSFTMNGIGSYEDIIFPIVMLGIFLTLIGLSNRLNSELIYMMMYDKYYMGMQEFLMTTVQKAPVQDLLKRELNDKYTYVVMRGGSLTDIMSSLCATFGKLVSIISILIVAFTASKPVFYLSGFYVIFVLVMSFVLSDKIFKHVYKVMKAQRISNYWEEMPHGKSTAREIRIFNNERQVTEHWEEAYKPVFECDMLKFKNIELQDFVSSISYYVFLIIIIAFSIFNVARGTVTVDVFLIVFALCNNIYKSFDGFGGAISGFTHGLFALEQQREFEEIMSKYEHQTAEHDEVRTESETVFNTDGISFSYRGDDDKAISDVSLSINRGEVIALVGRNGSGKTTLVKLLLNLFTPQEGSVMFCGDDINGYSPDFINSRIGVFFQDYYLFHHTTYENIAYGDIDNFDDEDRVMEAVKKGGAEGVLAKMPKGLETVIGNRIDKSGVELSGGEKQRIAAARAHMSSKDILIFDEPAAMLDPIAEMEQFFNIQNKLDGRTAILISHRVGFARLADRIIMMDEGRIIETGTHEELMAMKGDYCSFFNEQAKWYDRVDV